MIIIKKLLELLTPSEKRRGLLILIMVTAMAALEVVGVASVMPFLSVLGDPESVHENETLATAYELFAFDSIDQFLIALGIGAFLLILISALFRTLTHYAMNRFIEMRRHSIGERLLETYLRQPYAFFLNRHTSDMAKGILSEVDQVVANAIRPAVEMTAYGIVLFGLIILLLVVDPVLALVVFGVLGVLYGAMYAGVRGPLNRIGHDRAKANQSRFAASGEALGGIKDIKLLGRERAYLSRFRGPSVRFSRHQATNMTLGQVPNFIVEAVAFGGIIALTLVLLAAHGGATAGGLGGILPMLGLYAFAGLRVKPAAQKVYQGLAQLRFGAAAVENLYEDLRYRSQLAELHYDAPESLTPQGEIRLENVHYRYPGAGDDALIDIDLAVPVGTSIGLVGTTGAGKTTLVDVLLGLLRPTEGGITVDGEAITDDKLRAYQQALGYVPQEIFLTDSTVAENIALGVPVEDIDHDRVIRSAHMAQVHEFIMRNMPNQYATMVGERGVRLSGGQRQRIGIARALYHDPSVLVFDEATSALDSATERAVMDAIEGLHHQKTVILIAHRLSTVRTCDQVVLLDEGRVVAQGTYEEMEATSPRFRSLAGETARVQ